MKKLKRMGALLLSVLLTCQTIIYFPAKAADSAEGSGTVALGNSAIAYTQKLTDNGNGTYTLTLTVKDASHVKVANQVNDVSHNGYFTAPSNGDYLFELWGGVGADGSSGTGAAGTGGSGGHVYGVVTLKKGETLYYQLGGNGEQTLQSDTGGGANGDGGASGGLSNYSIGGGGGYSALYKFDPGEFESNYLDAEGNMTVDNISEADRVSKFIAIAAGGGGGGAGSVGSDGFLGTGWLTDLGNPPNGGDGGSMDSVAMAVDGGTVYVGTNGSSSGTSTAYVGLGGADLPATYVDSITTLFDTVQANDWYGVTNTDLAGGAGGSGNLRGGGGGAGYAGGGGGIQESILRAAHVGGGGGGSSYLSDAVTAPTQTQIEEMKDKPTGGGAICITPVSGVMSEELQGVTLTITPSAYFNISVTGLQEGRKLDISDEVQTVEITFTPISGFAGGNNVPLLTGNAIACENEEGTGCSIPLKADCAAVNVPLNFEVDIVNHTTNVAGEKHSLDALHGTTYSDIDLNQTIYAFIDSVSGYTVDHSRDDTYVEAENAVYPESTTYYTVSITVTPKTSGGYAVVGKPVTTTSFFKDAAIIVLMSDYLDLNGNSIGYNKTLTSDGNGNYLLSLITDISSDSTQYAGSPKTYSTPGTATYNVDYSGYYYIQAWGGDGGKGGNIRDGKNTGGVGGFGSYLEGYVYLCDGEKLNITVGSVGQSIDGDAGKAHGAAGGGGTATKVNLSAGGETTTLLIAGGGGGGGGARYKRVLFSDSGHNGLGRGETVTKLQDECSEMLLNGAIMGNTLATVIVNQNTIIRDADGSSLDVYATQEEFDNAFNGEPGSAGGEGVRIGNNPIAGNAGLSYINTKYIQSDNPPVDVSGYDFADHRGMVPKLESNIINDKNMKSGAVTITPLQLESQGSQADIADYIVSAQLSDYFELADAENNYEASITMYADKEKTTVSTDEIAIKVDAGLITVSDIDPKVNETTQDKEETDSNGNKTTVTTTIRSATFVLEFKLKPKDGFLGGNDVPILKEDSNNMSMSYAQDDVNGDPQVEEIGTDPATDYANVVILELKDYVTLTTNENTIVTGESVDREDMYSYESSLPDDWKDDYVTLTETLTVKGDTDVIEGETLSPERTTVYTVTLSLEPKYAATKAVVLPEIVATTVPGEPIIYVLPQIRYRLNNITASDELDAGDSYLDGYVTINPGEDHTATLTAAAGYKLPDTITVTAADRTDISGLVGYNASTGKFTIPARYAVGTITVSASAVEETYTITAYYPNPDYDPTLEYDPENIKTHPYLSQVFGPYKEDADISDIVLPTMDEMTGYTFVWDWGEFDFAGNPIMPNRDLTVIGTYVANKYTLTVHHYKNGSTEPVADDETFEVAYDSTQTVTAKEITGWLASVPSAEVTMDTAAAKEYTFYYTATSGQLNITYLFADGSQAAEKHNQTISTDQAYSVESPDIAGYTPDITVVSGTATGENAENGINITVTYTPNRYTVTFDPDGGTEVSPASRLVEYGNGYNYDPGTGAYGTGAWPGLPDTRRAGYNFVGWYLGDTLITEGTEVATASDHTLTARWEARELTATVRYIYEDGTLISKDDLGIDNPATVTGTAGGSYRFESPGLAGYTYDQAVVEGTFGTTSPAPVTVTYEEIKEYTLTVIARSTDGLITHTSSEQVKAGETYTVKVAEDFDGYFDSKLYYRDTNVDDIITGTMPAGDKVIYIDYFPKDAAEVISVTVTWGSLLFDYTYGAWQPTRHTYADDTIEVAENLSNTVTVSSESNVVVDVSIAYDPLAGYEGIDGFFTENPEGYGSTINAWELRNGESKTVYLWLDGEMERNRADGQCGTCTVTIEKGGG